MENRMLTYCFSQGDIFDALEYAAAQPLRKDERGISANDLQSALREIARVRTGSDHIAPSNAQGMSMKHGGEPK